MLTIESSPRGNSPSTILIERKTLTEEQAGISASSVQLGRKSPHFRRNQLREVHVLNVLAGFIPEQDRILILEDVAELFIRKPHVISAEAQLDTHKSQVGFADLLKAALRHRPDRIIVGEIRARSAGLSRRPEYRPSWIALDHSC